MLKQIDPDAALELVLSNSPPSEVQHLELSRVLNKVLAESVIADRDYPPFNRSMMDGYAIRMADVGKSVKVVGEIAAGQYDSVAIQDGTCISIMTGAACPAGTEAVVKKEVVQEKENQVFLPNDVKPGQFMVVRGSECAEGATAVVRGTLITPLVIGVLSSIGQLRVPVFAPPSISVITTGSELVPNHEKPNSVSIRNSNGPMLRAQILNLGLNEPLMLHAQDNTESLALALKKGMETDIIVLTGGVSMGRYDLVPQAVLDLGAKPIFHKVTQKPGKPLLFAKLEKKLIFGLPGHPLSSNFCFHRYVASAVRKMMGKPIEMAVQTATLTSDFEIKSDRTIFIQSRVDRQGPDYVLTPLVGQGSADLFSTARSNAYFRLPEGQYFLSQGAELDFQWFGND